MRGVSPFLLVTLAGLALACGDSGSSSAAGASGSGAGPGAGGAPSTTGTASGGAGGAGAAGGVGPGGAGPVDCAPLEAPTGPVVDVGPGDAANLASIVFDAEAGTTVRLAAGTYPLSSILQLRADGVTLRSLDDDASSVVLDGGYVVPELLQVTANDVTIAHVTLTRAVDHLVHAFPPGDGSTITGLRVHGVRLVDGGEQFIKVNPVGDGGFVDEGRVECSTFELTDAGRANVEPCCGGCYTGGIDVHAAWGFRVAKNRFEGIYCDGAGLAEHAIHFWKGARDTVVEDNVIVDCARGIGFGLENGAGDRVYPDAPYGGIALAHIDGVIQNNMIWADLDWFDTGIEIAEAREPLVAHNTVVTPGGASFFSSIDVRFAITEATVVNNLTTKLTERDGPFVTSAGNVEQAPLGYFLDAGSGDLHLTGDAPLAEDAGVPLVEVSTDIDGEARSATTPDVGADER